MSSLKFYGDPYVDNVEERSDGDFGDGASSIRNTNGEVGPPVPQSRLRNTVGGSPGRSSKGFGNTPDRSNRN